MLTREDIKTIYSGRYPLNPQTLRMANRIMDELWTERNGEWGKRTADRSGSCKFAALLARELFGGKLAGNQRHVFVVRAGKVLDLNSTQEDVKALGSLAHMRHSSDLLHRDYRESLASCLPRVQRWIQVFEKRYHALAIEQDCTIT